MSDTEEVFNLSAILAQIESRSAFGSAGDQRFMRLMKRFVHAQERRLKQKIMRIQELERELRGVSNNG